VQTLIILKSTLRGRDTVGSFREFPSKSWMVDPYFWSIFVSVRCIFPYRFL